MRIRTVKANFSGSIDHSAFKVRVKCTEGRRQTMADQRESGAEEIPPPTGTTFVMVLYMLLLTGMWTLMFLGLIGKR